ncbi:lantibiotic dehydratase C-terminal domain-containing protein [Streptomyces sp. NPDC002513]
MTAPTASPSETAADDAPGTWLAVHVFYAASPRPLLLQCVKPLVDALTEEGLLAGHFFINYWLEGPHLRLRLKPARAAHAAAVRERTHAALAAFLRERPALYEVKAGFLADLYETLFTLEYSEDQRAELLGPDGRMKLRPNNTFEDRPYEPEYAKYGGPAGVALAEWHFQHSSDLVIEAARSMNLHLRTVLLGLSAQLMMVMSGTFLGDDEALLAFLDRYHMFWNRAFSGTSYTADSGYDRAYSTMGARLPERFQHIREAVAQGEPERLPAFLRGWAAHCAELRDRAAGLARRGELTFRAWDGTRDIRPCDPAHALPMLLSPYLHMTNNRLSLTVRDEAFLSYVLARALRDGVPEDKE